MLIPLAEATPATSGGKAAVLGRLARAGLPVPPGFVVPLATYRAATAGKSPPGLVDALDLALAALGDPPVAVRSSVTTEDTAQDSAAGQHDSFLGVHGASAVAERVRACWASLWSDRAVAYRSARGTTAVPEAAVLVQRHVRADVAGVLFTDPTGRVVVEASWGLGESVVQGVVTPDSWTVADGAVTARSLGSKATRVDLRGERVVTREVPDADRRRPCLDDLTVLRLADLGREVSTLLGGPQDVEWAVEDGEVRLLQARPVTATLPAPGARGTPSGTVLTGTPGSSGTASGPARPVSGPGDFGRVRPGDVLVCRWTDPAWTPLFGVVAAVVTETGGALSHAAIVAREHRIPAVLAVPGALTTLRDGVTVVVDGTAGTVSAAGYGAVMQYTADDGWPVLTDRLSLRPVTADDADAFLAWRSLPDVVRYMYQPPWTPELAREKLTTWAEAPFAQPGDALVLAIEERGRPGVVGETLLKWAAGPGQAEVGYALHPDVHGRGYALEAARAALALAFGRFGFHRVFARIDEENTASVRVCERLGMRQEARLVENDQRDGVWSTEVVYAMLAAEHAGVEA